MPFALKVATKDSHPTTHVSFTTSVPPPNNKPFVDQVQVTNPTDPSVTIPTTIWPVHCVQGTPGAAIIPEIDASAFNLIVEKGRDENVEMYSAFCDMFGNKGAHMVSHDLGEVMREKGVTHVFVVGVAGDYCVKCTAVDASKEGFETVVVREGVRSVDEEGSWKGAVEEMQGMGIRVVGMDGVEVGRVEASSI
jgi:nicotinamidase-related amidase